DFSSTATYASLGRRLRARRVARCMGIAEVAVELRVPMAIVEAMENDDHAQLGAVVFARERLIGYARLVGVPVEAVEAQFAHAFFEPPPPVEESRSSRLESLLRHLARPGMQGAIA